MCGLGVYELLILMIILAPLVVVIVILSRRKRQPRPRPGAQQDPLQMPAPAPQQPAEAPVREVIKERVIEREVLVTKCEHCGKRVRLEGDTCPECGGTL